MVGSPALFLDLHGGFLSRWGGRCWAVQGGNEGPSIPSLDLSFPFCKVDTMLLIFPELMVLKWGGEDGILRTAVQEAVRFSPAPRLPEL